MPPGLNSRAYVYLPLNAPDTAPWTYHQSGRLTRLDMTIDFSILHIEGAVMADNLSLVIELIRIVPAVWSAVIRITRVVAVNGDARANKGYRIARAHCARK